MLLISTVQKKGKIRDNRSKTGQKSPLFSYLSVYQIGKNSSKGLTSKTFGYNGRNKLLDHEKRPQPTVYETFFLPLVVIQTR